MKSTVTVYRFLYYFIILYILSTMTQDIVSLKFVNRIFYAGITLCIVALLLKRIEKKALLYLSLIGVDILLVHFVYGISENILDYVYFVTSLIWLLFIVKRERRIKLLNEFQQHRFVNKIVIVFSLVLIVVALITRMGYQNTWGGDAFFVGFSSLTHTAASSMCLVGALILLTYCEEKFSWIMLAFLLIISYGIFETGARTYIVPAFILVVLYVRGSKGDKKIKNVIYGVGLAVAVILLTSSNIMNKFDFTSNIQQYNKVDELAQQTSGRSIFWLIDLQGFWEGSLFAKIFGHGHGYTYDLNERLYNLRVWAHNDFIQLLVGGGILSLFIYVVALWRSAKNVLVKHKVLDKWILILYFMFPAFFNGFYNYSHYFLSFIVICLFYDKRVASRVSEQ